MRMLGKAADEACKLLQIFISCFIYSNYSVDDTATTSFLETPPMSTYLLAFIISDFPYRTNTNNPMVFRHRVYSPPSAVGMSRLGLQNAELLLHALERYLQLNFSLPKMDQVAVPGFGPSAVENWG